jgi:hypothetical protein
LDPQKYLLFNFESSNTEFPRLPKPELARGGQGKNNSQILNIKYLKNSLRLLAKF